MKNIRYWGNQALPGGLKRRRNGAKMLIIDNFTCILDLAITLALVGSKQGVFE